MVNSNYKDMFDLSSFAISIAANVVCDFLFLELTSVDKDIKAAYKAAEEKFFPDRDLRDSVSVDRRLRFIKRDIARIVNEPDKKDTLDRETLAFLQFFEKEIAKRPAAYNYLKGITNEKRYTEIVGNMEEVKEGIHKITDYLESARVTPFILYSSYIKQLFPENFCSNERLNEIIKILKGQAKTIRLVALSGMGKSRLVWEAFSEEPDSPLYYCEVFESRTLSAVQNICLEGGPCILILDNCPLSDFLKIKDLRDRYNKEVRLISLYNDPTETIKGDIELIKLEKKDLNSVVEEYLIKKLGTRNHESFQRLYEFSDGIPYMAILLVDAFLVKNFPEGYISDDTLFDRLLGLDEKNSEDVQTKQILQAYALFHPLGVDGEYDVQLNFVANHPHIAPLSISDSATRLVLFNNVRIRYEEKQLMEHLGCWVNIRPLPLAVWLVNQWFRYCTEESVYKIIKGIQALPEYHSKALSEAFAKRIKYLADNDRAHHTFEKLLKPGAPFGYAKVINTELGSCLFRSFAQVNPVATSDLLYTLFENAPFEQLFGIEGEVRRNLIWTLESLCFAKTSFNKAAKTLARFAIAENENWSNNAVGTFIQLFQVLLPGTEADLMERFAVIQYCYNQGQQYQQLTLKAIDKALAYGHFYRGGGSEKQGLKVLGDYEPSKHEIFSYWKNCVNLLIGWVGKDKEIVKEGAEIVTKHARSLYRAGCASLFLELLNGFAIVKENDWEEMLDTLYTIVNYDFEYGDEESNNQVREWINRLTKQDFYSRFCNVQKYGHQHEKMDWEKIVAAQAQLYNELAEEYVEKWWSDVTILNSFYENQYPFANAFVSKVCELESEQPEKTRFFISKSLEILRKKELPSGYPFFVYYCYYIKDAKLKEDIFNNLFTQVQYPLLFAVAAAIDTGLKYFHLLSELIRSGKAAIENFKLYLTYQISANGEERIQVYEETLDLGRKGAILLIPYLSRLSYNKEALEDKRIVSLIQKCVLLVLFDDTVEYDRYEVVRLVEKVLKNGKEKVFAVELNRKIIESLKTSLRHYNLYDSIFRVLIEKYGEAIWEDLSQALLAENEDYMVYHNLNRILGSGIGLGAGPLFMYEDEKLLEWCKDNPQKAPERLAAMVPIYKYEKNESGRIIVTGGFSSIILRLLEGYGSKKEVLNSLNANMNSFSWIGSVIPLYKQKKMAFEQLLTHPNIEVVKWAEEGIKRAEAEIEYETKRENYEHFAYDSE